MRNKKFYTLNPEFYKELWERDKSSLAQFEPLKPSNQSLKPLDFKHRLKKALSGWHKGLLFDSAFLHNSFFDSYIEQALKQDIKPALQISFPRFLKQKKQIENLIKKYPKLEVHLLCESPPKEEDLDSDNYFLVYGVTKKNYKSLLKANLPLAHKSWLYFPYKHRLGDAFLSLSQIYRFIQQHPQIPVYPVDIYDKRIAQDMDLEPLTKPFASRCLPNNKIEFSVIIPCYNGEKQILNTLKALAEQDYPRNQYEVIVVDDGSVDKTRAQIQSFIRAYPALNIKGISFPRVREKQKNQACFRAGIARNLGVKHSSGNILAFLDSDILTPPNYLSQLKKEHQTADVLLLKRYHLKARVRVEDVFYKDISQQVYIENKKYWGDFYKKGFDKVACPWKYTCTYALSVFKKDFLSVGAFGKVFLFYGFEDTDLGYRLFKQNKKFVLSSLVVYHQKIQDRGFKPGGFFKEPQDFLFKQKQLYKSGKIFFQRHLDPDIYRELRRYLKGWHSS